MKLCGRKIVLFNCPQTALQPATTGRKLMPDRTLSPVDPTPALDMLRLWRDASALAQQLDEALLVIGPQTADFLIVGRARRWQHKTARLLAGRLQLASGRAVG